MRIVMIVSPAFPELLADLERIPSRLRPERIRALATIGLAALHRGQGTPRHVEASVQHPDSGPERRLVGAAKALGDHL